MSAQGDSQSYCDSGRRFECDANVEASPLIAPLQLSPEPPKEPSAGKPPDGRLLPDAQVSGTKVPKEIRCIELQRAECELLGQFPPGS